MTYRQIIIGDVHGNYEALMLLLEKIAPSSNDAVYFLGDLIDRGPESAQVVDFVIKNNYHCVLGNHEQMLLDALGNGQISANLLQYWLYSGGYATLLSYNHSIPQEHIDWIQALPGYLDLGNIWLVHAGIHPHIPLEEQTFEQFCWIRDEFHSMKNPYFPHKLIITGHTITFTFPGVAPGKIVQGNGWLDIDTGAYHPQSGWLTGLDITNRQVFQAHTTQKIVRMLPLEEATFVIDPADIAGKRAKAKASS